MTLTRTYSGLWLAGFKKAWTNNPAWLFRELAKNTRFGLAKRAGYIDVDDGASMFCLSIAISLLMMGTAAKSHA
jgi:predicted phage tail protein